MATVPARRARENCGREGGLRAHGRPFLVSTQLLLTAPDAEPQAARVHEPVTLGVPFPRGLLQHAEALSLTNADGDRVFLQGRALSRWPDDSVRWALLDFQGDLFPGSPAVYTLSIGSEIPTIALPPGLVVSDADGEIVVDTGAARFSIRPGGAFPFGQVVVEGQEALDPRLCGLEGESADGERWATRIAHAVVEERGPVRASVLVAGDIGPGRRTVLKISARLHFFAGLATSRVEITVTNPRRAVHRGGCWDLGDAGSVLLRDLSLVLTLADSDDDPVVRCSAECGNSLVPVDTPFELYQDSSGGENWRSINHINRDRVVPHTLRGYRLSSTTQGMGGLRATPIVVVERSGRILGTTAQHFWENFPKAIEVVERSVFFRLWPRQSSGLHEIQGGEQKTHVLHVAFASDTVDRTPLQWCRSPLTARADPAWYCGSGAVPYLVPEDLDGDLPRRRLIEAAIDADTSFERKRETIDEYGWRHFGDIYADHEAVFHSGPTPLVSHYNNQYDAIAGFACQFMRSGDHRWRRQMSELAAHVSDIDIYHTSEDRAAYNGGMFWHTAHHTGADTATHRTYPRASKAGGGGPSSEHNYTTGLMLHYFLTGDSRSREAAVGLARWVIAMDDGGTTMFRWLDRGYTGFASASGSADYHGPGRGAANSIRALVDAHLLTGDRLFLEKAEQLIRRCINPNDSIEARNLPDVEHRWFYTVFLQALGRYLDYKIELGELDDMYGYARASLLAYGRWMIVHEHPYLEHPEILEFPNETWVAQDIRKSDVFLLAAKHAGSADRRLFMERAAFFFTYSTSTLVASPDHTRTRPTVLMMTNGLLAAYFAQHPEEQAPPPARPAERYGGPMEFVPQKKRAVRRAVWTATAGALVMAGLMLWLAS